jgi:hypothetical protein
MDFVENKPEQGDSGLDLLTMLIRLGLALVFLVSFAIAIGGWCLIGGTGHFEITAWYWKCGLCLGWALAMTAAVRPALIQRDGWQARTKRWLGVVLLISIAMGSVTYYYHLQEPPEEDIVDEQSTAQL